MDAHGLPSEPVAATAAAILSLREGDKLSDLVTLSCTPEPKVQRLMSLEIRVNGGDVESLVTLCPMLGCTLPAEDENEDDEFWFFEAVDGDEHACVARARIVAPTVLHDCFNAAPRDAWQDCEGRSAPRFVGRGGLCWRLQSAAPS